MKRVWIFASERPFSEPEETSIYDGISSFLLSWQAHGKSLKSEINILEHQFIKISVDESIEPASGCSIDSLTAKIKEIETTHDLTLMNRMNIFFKKENGIHVESLPEFKSKLKNGVLNKNIKLYHTGVSNEQEFKTSWLLPIEKTWAKNILTSS